MTLVLENPTLPVVAVVAYEADRGRMQDALPRSLRGASCQTSIPNSAVTGEDRLQKTSKHRDLFTQLGTASSEPLF